MAPAKRSTEGRSRVPLLLGLAGVAAAVLLWDRWADWGNPWGIGAVGAPGAAETTAPGADTKPRGAGASALPLASLPLDKLQDTVRRPLFEKTRRPVEPPPPVMARPPPAVVTPKRVADPNALTLLGVLTSDGPGSGAIALMRRNQTGQSVRLQEGDTVDGWTIERIESARVLLKQGDTQIALELFRRR